MDQRLKLQAILEGILGVKKVYFQPPSNISLEYPCIVYSRDDRWVEHGDNRAYAHKKRYSVTVIDRNPDSEIPEKIAYLPMSSFSRHFVNDNLNHDIYNLYF